LIYVKVIKIIKEYANEHSKPVELFVSAQLIRLPWMASVFPEARIASRENVMSRYKWWV